MNETMLNDYGFTKTYVNIFYSYVSLFIALLFYIPFVNFIFNKKGYTNNMVHYLTPTIFDYKFNKKYINIFYVNIILILLIFCVIFNAFFLVRVFERNLISIVFHLFFITTSFIYYFCSIVLLYFIQFKDNSTFSTFSINV